MLGRPVSPCPWLWSVARMLPCPAKSATLRVIRTAGGNQKLCHPDPDLVDKCGVPARRLDRHHRRAAHIDRRTWVDPGQTLRQSPLLSDNFPSIFPAGSPHFLHEIPDIDSLIGLPFRAPDVLRHCWSGGVGTMRTKHAFPSPETKGTRTKSSLDLSERTMPRWVRGAA